MSKEQQVKYISDSEYLEFVKERLENSNYQAEAKLKQIDEMAEMILIAKKNYQEHMKK